MIIITGDEYVVEQYDPLDIEHLLSDRYHASAMTQITVLRQKEPEISAGSATRKHSPSPVAGVFKCG